MNKIKFILISIFFFSSIISMDAQEIILKDKKDNAIEEKETICANQDYYVTSDGEYQEILVLDANTKTILEVYNSNSKEIKISFPDNAGEIVLVSTKYTAEKVLDPTTESRMDLKVEDCGYTGEKKEYDKSSIQSKISLENDKLMVAKPNNLLEYSLTYHFLDEKNSKLVDFSESIGEIKLNDKKLVQLMESYKDGETQVQKYYELEINPNNKEFFIRVVSDFEVKRIDLKGLIDVKKVLILLILLVIFISSSVMYKKTKKQYRNEKILDKKRKLRRGK